MKATLGVEEGRVQPFGCLLHVGSPNKMPQLDAERFLQAEGWHQGQGTGIRGGLLPKDPFIRQSLPKGSISLVYSPSRELSTFPGS